MPLQFGPFALLVQNRNFRLLWFARTVSFFGDTLAGVALVIYASRTGLEAVGVGLLLLVQTAPRLLGPLAGAYADRFERKRLMIISDVAQVVVFGLIALLPPLPILLALVAVGSLFSTLFLPASRSLMPSLVSAENLGQANSLMAMSMSIGLALAPALASLLIVNLGLPGTFLLNACSFLVSALIVLGIRYEVRPAEIGKAVAGATLEGIRYVMANRSLRALAVGFLVSVMFIGLDNVALVFLARDVLGSEPSYGLMLSLNGLGMIIGPLLVLLLRGRIGFVSILLAGLLLEGVSTALTGLAPAIALAVLWQGFMGVGNSVENVAFETLVQSWSDPAFIGRAFGVMYTLPYLALLVTYSLGGPLLALTSARVVLVIAGVGTLFALALVWFLLAPDES